MKSEEKGLKKIVADEEGVKSKRLGSDNVMRVCDDSILYIAHLASQPKPKQRKVKDDKHWQFRRRLAVICT